MVQNTSHNTMIYPASALMITAYTHSTKRISCLKNMNDGDE